MNGPQYVAQLGRRSYAWAKCTRSALTLTVLATTLLPTEGTPGCSTCGHCLIDRSIDRSIMILRARECEPSLPSSGSEVTTKRAGNAKAMADISNRCLSDLPVSQFSHSTRNAC
jgi:hypothetical protein